MKALFDDAGTCIQKGYGAGVVGIDLPSELVDVPCHELQLQGGVVVRKTLVSTPISPDKVKAEARRRIEASGLPWMVEREVSGGAPIPQAIKEYAAKVREASGILESYQTIPADYFNDRHWPELPF